MRPGSRCRIWGDDSTASWSVAVPKTLIQTDRSVPLAYPKKSWHGQPARLRLLANAGVTIPDDLGPVGSIPPDDIIDAAEAAWSADRIANGKVGCLGVPALDAKPNPSAGQIWY